MLDLIVTTPEIVGAWTSSGDATIGSIAILNIGQADFNFSHLDAPAFGSPLSKTHSRGKITKTYEKFSGHESCSLMAPYSSYSLVQGIKNAFAHFIEPS